MRRARQDRVRAFQNQPLDDMKEYLLPRPPDQQNLVPPLLHYGWILDTERIYEYAERHGIHAKRRDENGEHRSYYRACLSAVTPMLEELGIPDDPRITIQSVSNGDYRLNPTDGHVNFHIALTVGNNYKGLIPWEHIDKLGNLAAPNVQMKWYLDSERWQWMRRPRKERVRGVSSAGAYSICSLLI